MKNKFTTLITLALLLTTTALPAQTPQLKAAAISAGAARLDNGSIVNIGQPFVGAMFTPGGVSLSMGILPVLGTNAIFQPVPPSISPGVQMQGSVFLLSFQAQAGLNYVVEASTNLLSDGWLPIWTNTGSGTSLLFQDAQTGQRPWRFYRLRSP